MKSWTERTDEQAQDARRRAVAELFFHSCFNPSNTSKVKARLEALEKENEELKHALSIAEKE